VATRELAVDNDDLCLSISPDDPLTRIIEVEEGGTVGRANDEE
jgi:hypothetical protein